MVVNNEFQRNGAVLVVGAGISGMQSALLLAEAGYQSDVWPPDESAEDDPCSDETPEHLVARLARRKAESVVEYLQSGATGVSPVPNPPTPSADSQF